MNAKFTSGNDLYEVREMYDFGIDTTGAVTKNFLQVVNGSPWVVTDVKQLPNKAVVAKLQSYTEEFQCVKVMF